MMLRDPRVVYADYEKTQQDYLGREDNYHTEDIKSYFDNSNNSYVPLSNNHGMVACGEYAEFVSSLLFCPDGSWIDYGKKSGTSEEAQDKVRLLEIIKDNLSHSNFYSTITRQIYLGALYNKGIMDISWSGGLQFTCIENENIYCSFHNLPAHQRTYAEKWFTKEELIIDFEGEGIDRYSGMSNQRPIDLQDKVKVLTCILPINKFFFDVKRKGKYTHKKVYILCDGDYSEIKRKGDKDVKYKNFPLMTYLPHQKHSLAYLALASAVKLDMYEDQIGENARKVNSPPMGIPQEILNNGQYDLGEKGIVPLPSGLAAQPQPIETKLQMQLSYQDVQRHEMKIDRIFKIPLIERLKVTNVTQYEAAGNILAAYKAITPAAADLMTRIPSTLLTRVHELLKKYNEEYRYLANKLKVDSPNMGGLEMNMKRIEQAYDLGRLAQGVAPYLQAYPEAKSALNPDRVMVGLAESWNSSDKLNSDEEKEAEREQMQAQQEQLRAQQQALNDAQVNKLNSEGGQNEQ